MAEASESKPIDITSNTMTFHSRTRTAVAEGDVWAGSEDFTLTSRRAVARYGAGRRIEHLEAHGDVVIIRSLDGLKVEGDEAEFDRIGEVAVVRGSPVATRPSGDVLKGELMTLFLQEDRLETTIPRLFLAETAAREAVTVEGEWMESLNKGAHTVFERNVVLLQGDLVAKGDRLDAFSEDSDEDESLSADSSLLSGDSNPSIDDAQPHPEGGETELSEADVKDEKQEAQDNEDIEIRTLVLTGNVDVTRGEQRARAARGVYDPVTQDLVLEGSPVVTEGENVIRGDRIVMDGATGVARATRARVRMRAE